MLISCKKSSVVTGNYTITVLALDWDSKIPLPGTKVYLTIPVIQIGSSWIILDSSITDASGKAVFTTSYGGPYGGYKEAYAISKPGYIQTPLTGSFGFKKQEDRTDTIYLARPSFVNLTIHNYFANLPGDSVEIKVKGCSGNSGEYYGGLATVFKGLANSPDRVINLQAFYSSPNHTKLEYQYYIWRNLTLINFGGFGDYIQLTQFGTANYTINY